MRIYLAGTNGRRYCVDSNLYGSILDEDLVSEANAHMPRRISPLEIIGAARTKHQDKNGAFILDMAVFVVVAFAGVLPIEVMAQLLVASPLVKVFVELFFYPIVTKHAVAWAKELPE